MGDTVPLVGGALVQQRLDALNAERARLQTFVEEQRPEGTRRPYECYIKQYKAYAQEKDFPLDSDVTLSSFIRASAVEGKGRGTCTDTIPSAVAHLFRYY